MSKYFTIAYLLLVLRYLIIAGVFFLIFYIVKPKKYLNAKLQKAFPKSKDYYREIGYSILSSGFFALFSIIIFRTPVREYSQVYNHISEHGWPYFIFTVFMALALHDTYFYWTHRLMHHPKLFKTFHLAHHKSTNPSPWAAFAFHPLEAIVEAGILPVLVFVMPITPLAVLVFFLISTVINVYGHLGYEIYPAWLIKSKLGRWINTSVSHNMHHKYFTGNYGFYTRVWDVLMGTMNPDYEASLKEVLAAKTK